MALTANEIIEQNLWSYLTDDATLSALIGTRLYPLVAPQNPTRHPTTKAILAYGIYRRISATRHWSHDGSSGLAQPRFQIDWVGGQAEDGRVAYATAQEVAMECRKLLDGFAGTLTNITVDEIRMVDDRDLYVPDLKQTVVSQDYLIMHKEATS